MAERFFENPETGEETLDTIRAREARELKHGLVTHELALAIDPVTDRTAIEVAILAGLVKDEELPNLDGQQKQRLQELIDFIHSSGYSPEAFKDPELLRSVTNRFDRTFQSEAEDRQGLTQALHARRTIAPGNIRIITDLINYPGYLGNLAKLYEHDPISADHTYQATIVLANLLDSLGFPEDQKRIALFAMLNHDMGKRLVPGSILRKPGRLDAKEEAIMDSHVLAGYNLLEDLSSHDSLYAQARTLFVHHHGPEVQQRHYNREGKTERRTGPSLLYTGPERRRGDRRSVDTEEILLRQAIGAADRYEAMTSPLRDALYREGRAFTAAEVRQNFDQNFLGPPEFVRAIQKQLGVTL